MVVDDFTLDGLPLCLRPLFTTLGNFKVGGRLHVNAGQADGYYTGSLSVSVNYF